MSILRIVASASLLVFSLSAFAQLEQDKPKDIENTDTVFYDMMFDNPFNATLFAVTIAPMDVDISDVNLNLGARLNAEVLIKSQIKVSAEYKKAYYDRIEGVDKTINTAYNQYPEAAFSIYKERTQAEWEVNASWAPWFWRAMKNKTFNVKSVGNTDYVVSIPIQVRNSIAPRIGTGYKSSFTYDIAQTWVGVPVYPTTLTTNLNLDNNNTTMVDMSYMTFGLNFQRMWSAGVNLRDFGERYLTAVTHIYADVMYAYNYSIDNVIAPYTYDADYNPIYGEYDLMTFSPFQRLGFRIGTEYRNYGKIFHSFTRLEFAGIPNIKRERSLRLIWGFGVNLGSLGVD